MIIALAALLGACVAEAPEGDDVIALDDARGDSPAVQVELARGGRRSLSFRCNHPVPVGTTCTATIWVSLHDRVLATRLTETRPSTVPADASRYSWTTLTMAVGSEAPDWYQDEHVSRNVFGTDNGNIVQGEHVTMVIPARTQMFVELESTTDLPVFDDGGEMPVPDTLRYVAAVRTTPN